MSDLRVSLAGEDWIVAITEPLTFGRDADLCVDTNPFLHRRLGRFRWEEGTWWLDNLGSATPLEVCDVSSTSRLTVAPGSAFPLAFGECLVRFDAGPSTYELRVWPGRSTDVDHTAPEDGRTTINAGQVPLNREQRLLLAALAERRLRDPAVPKSDIPPNRAVCARLGWSTKKFDGKLDNLCVRFTRLGVGGLKGDIAGLATNRRERLVDHVLTVGLIGPPDLALLDDGLAVADGPDGGHS